MDRPRILVIGAGLAGLTVARHLADAGQDVLIIEKSRAPGGRISTRRSDGGEFDHGAQYMTSRTPELNAVVNRLAQSGVLAPWRPGGKDSSRPWWVGQPGMSALGKALAEGLDIRLRNRAVTIARTDDGYRVEVETAEEETYSISAKRIVVAIPASQAHALLSPLDPSFSKITDVEMAPCWCAMIAFNANLDLIPDLIRGGPSDILSFISRNSSKPGRTGETFVLHASPEWSLTHLEDEKPSVTEAMLRAMQAMIGDAFKLPQPVHVDVHRWRYAQTRTPLGVPFVANAGSSLLACGDWCIGARIEAAHQSGLAAARHITSL
ncbi:MAG: FAD-dependent oxidoreductase [Hoeflea sp.]|uniref:NAD(P)/FAD-dependent oxidoreductase n=1 Tax=Hoeflea sp. TaxID=1940281 RepID=UPI0032EF1F6A